MSRGRKGKARIRAFWLSVCPETGDPGCLDCVEGQCPGLNYAKWNRVRAHECTECRGTDAWGHELLHETTCSLYVAPVEVAS